MATVNEKKTATKTIVLPRAAAGAPKTVFVSVNDKTALVPRGVPVECEDWLYERLCIIMAAEDADINYREEVEKEARKMGML